MAIKTVPIGFLTFLLNKQKMILKKWKEESLNQSITKTCAHIVWFNKLYKRLQKMLILDEIY